MALKCPRGHWYEPDASTAGGGCPRCAIQTQNESTVSDDDVLAIMSLAEEPAAAPPASQEESKNQSGSGIMRRKKICPECSHEASFSFVYCPRCGAPLKLATVELRKG